ncbi:MAG: tetratricopeptide repeat protein [Microcoleus sp. PH2017_40_RAT_O_B]|uniref:tetratricopeptide repeat protein n=1 Tax=unclassified Microcoleus TaxID=2642155 RepID=UPI001E0CD825|nr:MULTISPECIES: tetratricopeptide repeat protein [unclassified Microcoleus]MCC3571028.1 tetratricopeptide repeat protein [Microcoleus sp. PH2017_34_RAT_O_A]MCC3608593.1 tetratricopeptide repeat protein [Microcoleus sp. PH2017_40_RAT_O_B]
MVNDMNWESAIAYLNEGNQLKEASFYDQALECYEKALEELNMETVEIYNQQAEVYCLQGKVEEAITYCQKALTIKPNYAVGYKTLGNVFLVAGKVEEARDSYVKAIEIQPDYAAALANLGSIYAQKQSWEEAISYYQKAIEIQPDFAGVYRNLARIFSQIDKLEEAAECSYLGLILEPGKATAEEFLSLGNSLLEQGNQDRAIICYRRAIDLNSSFYAPYQKLGGVLTVLKQWDEAIACYRKAIELNPSFPEAYYSLGEAQAQQWRWEEAVAAYSEAIELEPSYFEAHQKLGEAFHVVGKIDEAIACYRRALTITSNYLGSSEQLHSLHFNLGEALQRQGKFEEAMACYLKSLEFSPESSKVHHHLGTALSALQRWDDAVVAFRHAIEIDRDLFWSYHQLGLALIVLQKWDEALANLCRALAINPEAESVHSHLAVVLKSLPRWEEALVDFRLAVELNPTSAEVHYYLGTVLALVQQHDESVAFYQRAIQLKPDLFWFHQILKESIANKSDLELVYAAYQQAVRLQCENPEPYFYIGMLLTLSGRVNEARIAYQEALQIKPDYVAAYWSLAWLLSQQEQWAEAMLSYQKGCEINSLGAEEHFKKTSRYKFIKLYSLSEEDRIFLDDAGFSLGNLELIEQDNMAWKEVYPKIFNYSPDMPPAEFTMPAFQQRIFDTGYIDSVCPFTGHSLKSNQSLYIYPYYEICYRFVGSEVFYLIVGCWHSFKIGIYIPGRETIISFCDDSNSTMIAWQKEEIENIVNALKFYTCTSLLEMKDYIVNEAPKKLATNVGNVGNIGHYFWNQVSAFQELHDSQKLSNIDALMFGAWNYLDIRDIFPEIDAQNNPKPETFFTNDYQTPSMVFSMCLSNNLFLINVSSLLVTEKSANRLYHRSFTKCEPSFLQKVGESKKHFPLIWITLRSHTRGWLSQVEGIANIIKALSQDYPDLGIIFDGVPSEKANLEKIQALIPPTIKTYNALNCAVYETIVWSHAMDMFIAPYGAGLIFPCQIANKTGVLHTHKDGSRLEPFCLNPRENSLSIVPVSRDTIVDSIDSEYSNPNTRNYHIHWKGIYTETVNIIEQLNK